MTLVAALVRKPCCFVVGTPVVERVGVSDAIVSAERPAVDEGAVAAVVVDIAAVVAAHHTSGRAALAAVAAVRSLH